MNKLTEQIVRRWRSWRAPQAQPRVMVLNFAPIVRLSADAEPQPLFDAYGWNDPRHLAIDYCNDVVSASHNQVDYQIVDWVDVPVFPRSLNYTFTSGTYAAYWRVMQERGQWKCDPALDYRWVLDSWNIVERVNTGLIDEVWMFGAPGFGFWESHMVGNTPYWCNSAPLVARLAKRNFVVMGFSYERGVGEMLENLGHRSESHLTRVFGGWRTSPYATGSIKSGDLDLWASALSS